MGLVEFDFDSLMLFCLISVFERRMAIYMALVKRARLCSPRLLLRNEDCLRALIFANEELVLLSQRQAYRLRQVENLLDSRKECCQVGRHSGTNWRYLILVQLPGSHLAVKAPFYRY